MLKKSMLEKSIAACLLASALAIAPAMAQTASGPTPSGASAGNPAQTTAPGTADTQGKPVGAPQDPSSTDAQRGASLVPIAYVGLIALGAAAAFWYARRRRRGRV